MLYFPPHLKHVITLQNVYCRHDRLSASSTKVQKTNQIFGDPWLKTIGTYCYDVLLHPSLR